MKSLSNFALLALALGFGFSMSTSATQVELSIKLDFNCDLRVQFTNEDSGFYGHHMIAGVQLALSSWLDFDVSLV